LRALDACLQREYAYETNNYKLHKKMANLITDLGFLIADTPQVQHADPTVKSGLNSMFHKLIKKTDRHMIVVTYKLRRRLIITPKHEDMLDGTDSQTRK
jgi:hypothetical protein